MRDLKIGKLSGGCCKRNRWNGFRRLRLIMRSI